MEDNTISFFDAKLKKGDLIGALELSILEGEKASELARKTIEQLENQQKKMENKANSVLNKYPRL